MHKLKSFILDLIFPAECVNCGKEKTWLCKECFKKLQFKKNQYCLKCKKTNQYGEFCSDCSPSYDLNGIWIAGDYEDKILAKLIKNLKYKFTRDIALDLGMFLSLFLKNLINETRLSTGDIENSLKWRKFDNIKKAPATLLDFKNNIIIPIPLHKKRLNWRGFNQAEEIANFISKNFNIPLTLNLKRAIHKKPQAKLNEHERLENIKNCYIWQGKSIINKNVILVDDVTTTGSTLKECAKILKKKGAKEIWGLVVAKG